jgi:diacylglycerol kinase (ATP)
MRVVLLHNERAGDKEHSREKLVTLLRRGGYRPQVFDLHAALRRPAQLPPGEFVVVAGGDGSFRRAALRVTGRPLALLPLGTANNIAHTLGIAGAPAEIIAGWKKARHARFDAGVVRGPWGEQRFVEGVGCGLFGRALAILAVIGEETRPLGERADRMTSDVRAIATLAHAIEPLPMEVEFDGKQLAGDFLVLEVLNIGRVGPGVELARAADISDGMFDVVGIRTSARGALINVLRDTLRGKSPGPRLTTRRCRQIKLRLPRCDFRIDDQTRPVTKGSVVEARVDPGAVEVLLPA